MKWQFEDWKFDLGEFKVGFAGEKICFPRTAMSLWVERSTRLLNSSENFAA
jgi:hypothetical protein